MSYIDENGVIKNAVIQLKRRTTTSDVTSVLSNNVETPEGTPIIKSTDDATQSQTEGLVIKTKGTNKCICLPSVRVHLPVCRVSNIPEPIPKNFASNAFTQLLLKYFDVDLKYCQVYNVELKSNGNVDFMFKLKNYPGLKWDSSTVPTGNQIVQTSNIVQIVLAQIPGDVDSSTIKDYIYCPSNKNSYTVAIGDNDSLTVTINSSDYYGKFLSGSSSITVSTINNAYIIDGDTPDEPIDGNYKPFWIKPISQTTVQLYYYDGEWKLIQTGGTPQAQTLYQVGTQPTQSGQGTTPLWIDTSNGANVLKCYTSNGWITIDSIWGTGTPSST